ncbi:hypothetical protein Tco_1054255 [Tanacetum coccineum]|uniref:Uncharacterized protein n=1 Tax=Tanacetum coccineum TaxID=301880 RepID=A0ABQ5GYP5_9ASTR
MEFESTNSGTTAKLPILKLENGDSWVSVPQTAQENGKSVTKMSIPVTAEEKTNKKHDVKARSLLLKALPKEHQLTFSQYPDAKSMFAAIETRFGVSTASFSDNAVYDFMVENPNGSNILHQDLEKIVLSVDSTFTLVLLQSFYKQVILVYHGILILRHLEGIDPSIGIYNGRLDKNGSSEDQGYFDILKHVKNYKVYWESKFTNSY